MSVNYLLGSTFDKSHPAKYITDLEHLQSGTAAYGAVFNAMIHQDASKRFNLIYLSGVRHPTDVCMYGMFSKPLHVPVKCNIFFTLSSLL